MDVRYQIFVSSTFKDLPDERQAVFKVIQEMNHIPAGMEVFPAIDEEQMAFIRRVIDQSDYYLVIIAGRYGSLTPTGLSYTEAEFDYAVETGKKVIGLLHAAPDELPVNRSESAPEMIERLALFREKVQNGRLTKPWMTKDELAAKAVLAINHAVNTYPAVGWVRADKASTVETLSETLELRREVERLRIEVAPETNISDIASLDDRVEFSGLYVGTDMEWHEWVYKGTWGDVLGNIGPFLLTGPSEARVFRHVRQRLFSHAEPLDVPLAGEMPDAELDEMNVESIKVQFLALGLITVTRTPTLLVWNLTKAGEVAMYKSRVAKKPVKT